MLSPIASSNSKDGVTMASPSLADNVALRTPDYSISEIAAEIASVVQSPQEIAS